MGIIADTNRFLYPCSSPKTMQVSAGLISEYDIDKKELYENMYMRNLDEVRFSGYVLQNLKVTKNGVGYISITDDIQKQFGVDAASAGNMVNELTLNNNPINNNELVTEKEQNGFLNTTMGKVVNTAIDLGLRWVLPDFVENQVIDIKNSLLKGGLKEGISTTIEKGIELGKSITGIFTGKFENVSQAQNAIKNGGIIDGISDVLDSTLNYTVKKGLIPSSIGTLIRQGKNVILDNVSNNIETEFANQLDNIGKLGKYENNWKNYYQNQDFDGMEREYGKIKDRLKQTLPLEETLKQARQIENLHLIIKNNGHNFNLTEEQKKLAEILIK